MQAGQTQLERIADWLAQQGQPRFRIQQVRDAWFAKKSWDEALTLPKDLREQAAAEFPWISVRAKDVHVSNEDGTKKALLELADGALIETVSMPNARDKRTVCVSTQVGCGMGCAFCATGTLGFTRDLTADEIIDQVRFWRFSETEEISNIVFMGMGEPLVNYDAVSVAAAAFINDMEIGITKIIVSTVGPQAGLKRLLEDDAFPQVRIALSLHAGTDGTRSKIVPMHKGTSIAELAEWAGAYLKRHGNRRHHLTLEYVMLRNINDSTAEARALVRAFGKYGSGVKLNLIPWNPTGAGMDAPDRETLEAFQAIIEKGGIATTIRQSRGMDIAAACGQLCLKQ
ncbi:MAG: 23S rRNA (adenine(2503)-C(2))-methyltransferase RlmN [Candidatus Kerfeldbacteria bacterium]